ncbi:hypothetical protein P7K49_012378 [Saguinus oedipus]|uniref:Uncharacterized protein n=1 Tax=Saguinus oedipus TaxID=9490 RepID=A0ABQ9VT95_SAGOE|nr:hypothetical protein P7K49_012378 [Saguinus oedipus]
MARLRGPRFGHSGQFKVWGYSEQRDQGELLSLEEGHSQTLAPKDPLSAAPVWGVVGGDRARSKEDFCVSQESSRRVRAGKGAGGKPPEPRPRGQKMRGRCEVPR